MWSEINNLIKPNNKNRKVKVKRLTVGGLVVESEVDIAEQFNSFFSDVGRSIHDSVPPTRDSFRSFLSSSQQSISFLQAPTTKLHLQSIHSRIRNVVLMSFRLRSLNVYPWCCLLF